MLPPPSQSTGQSSTDTATSPVADTATAATTPASGAAKVDVDDATKPNVQKKTPYVNPERVKTGGLPRGKLTDEELAERMARMRDQNEKIKQRRLDVAADEDAFKQTQAAERQRQAHMRKVQETVDRTREQNARRKLDKFQSREWDSDKKAEGWPSTAKPDGTEQPAAPSSASITRTNTGDAETDAPPTAKPRGRGLGRRGRGRGRGRGEYRDRDKGPLAPAPAAPETAPGTETTEN